LYNVCKTHIIATCRWSAFAAMISRGERSKRLVPELTVSDKKVQKSHIAASLPHLHRSLLDIVTTMVQPERDAVMLEMAGLPLERALFPLLVLVERLGPIGVVDLANRVGRDYSTVSRQVARLEELELVTRRASEADARVREAVITRQGKIANRAIDAAREELAIEMFKDWTRGDFDELVRLLRRLADEMTADPRASNETVEPPDETETSARRKATAARKK
jgi:DNA-binding MarR family transcriptional regulator